MTRSICELLMEAPCPFDKRASGRRVREAQWNVRTCVLPNDFPHIKTVCARNLIPRRRMLLASIFHGFLKSEEIVLAVSPLLVGNLGR